MPLWLDSGEKWHWRQNHLSKTNSINQRSMNRWAKNGNMCQLWLVWRNRRWVHSAGQTPVRRDVCVLWVSLNCMFQPAPYHKFQSHYGAIWKVRASPKSEGFLLSRPIMSVQNVMAIYSIAVEIFGSGSDWQPGIANLLTPFLYYCRVVVPSRLASWPLKIKGPL